MTVGVVGGYCPTHANGGRDMRAVGRLGGRGRRGPRLAAGIPRSLRDALRDELDPDDVVAAVQRSLTGGNESARVSAVRLLSDLETFRRNDGESEPVYRRAVEEARQQLDGLLDRVAGHDPQLAVSLRRVVEAIASSGRVWTHEHTLEQAREVYEELAAIGVLARAPHLELEPPAA